MSSGLDYGMHNVFVESHSHFPSATTTASNGQLTNAVFGCVVLPSELITVTQ